MENVFLIWAGFPFIHGSGITTALSDSEDDDEDEENRLSDMDRLKKLQEETYRQAQGNDSESSDDEAEDNDKDVIDRSFVSKKNKQSAGRKVYSSNITLPP